MSYTIVIIVHITLFKTAGSYTVRRVTVARVINENTYRSGEVTYKDNGTMEFPENEDIWLGMS